MTTANTPALPRFAILPYAGTIFLSAFLLFLVQPVVAKQILPWFGGSAAVWTTCMVFFQCILLAGYAYADFTTRLGVRRQAAVHVGLLLVSLALLPILPDASWKPAGDAEPIGRILLLLTATIGLPYFLLSSTTPLLQAWYWQRFRSAVPYRLFALSNFASMLALLGFPVLFEPVLSLPDLGVGWSALYAVFAVICATTGIVSARAAARATGAPDADAANTGMANSAAQAPGAARQLLWLALSAMGSMMLLAVTNHVTQNIASVPFLWVIPLALYLLTFILCFDHPRWYRRGLYLTLLAAAVPAMAWFIGSLNLAVAAPLYFVGMFVACMVCHGELAAIKPDPQHLTRFYLMLSVGGALGAVLIAIVAPLTLPGYFELGIVLVLLAALLAVRLERVLRLLALGVTAASLVLVVRGAIDYSDGIRVMERDFYGVVRTRDWQEPSPYRTMYHGSIMHGGQLLGPQFKNVPADYFSPGSGYGRVFAALNELDPAKPRSVGVIGLGAGVLAAYGRPGDTMVFYEISPRVVDIARREFTLMADSGAKMEVVMGDGRLSLEREAPRRYDVMGIDAFSGDSIPMHLITREAMAQYARHLKDDGVIVFQATNRFVNLPPVIKRLATELGMHAVLVSDTPPNSSDHTYWYSSTDQVIVTRNKAVLAASPLARGATEIADLPGLATFTDAHHNLVRILK
ncbi:MAG: fused MFS/spermidine synthase [Burkholderiales bacterium]|nr:fused MFS/spermidine synthase [Burkholderiales bacterium]